MKNENLIIIYSDPIENASPEEYINTLLKKYPFIASISPLKEISEFFISEVYEKYLLSLIWELFFTCFKLHIVKIFIGLIFIYITFYSRRIWQHDMC